MVVGMVVGMVSILQTLRVAWVRTNHAQAEFLPCSTILKIFWTWFTCFWVHSFTCIFSRRDTSPAWPTFHLPPQSREQETLAPTPPIQLSLQLSLLECLGWCLLGWSHLHPLDFLFFHWDFRVSQLVLVSDVPEVICLLDLSSTPHLSSLGYIHHII